MIKLHADLIRFIDNIIDMRTPLTSEDREYITASIIQGTPQAALPSLDEMDKDMRLLDMVAAYMKTRDSDKGQDILDYITTNAVDFFANNIEEIMDDRSYSSTDARDERAYQRHTWNKDRI